MEIWQIVLALLLIIGIVILILKRNRDDGVLRAYDNLEGQAESRLSKIGRCCRFIKKFFGGA